jgi:outer membrane protein assembly factor BamE
MMAYLRGAASGGVFRLCALAALSATAVLPTGCTPYRIDIQQGNVVTQEMLARLRPDMTRQQVRYVMGTPLVADTFHPERWDYFYNLDKAGSPDERRRITLVFEKDRLTRVLGDVELPAGLGGQQGPADAGPAVTEDN